MPRTLRATTISGGQISTGQSSTGFLPARDMHRYIVIPISDAVSALSGEQMNALTNIRSSVDNYRLAQGSPERNYIVISDKRRALYEEVWGMFLATIHRENQNSLDFGEAISTPPPLRRATPRNAPTQEETSETMRTIRRRFEEMDRNVQDQVDRVQRPTSPSAASRLADRAAEVTRRSEMREAELRTRGLRGTRIDTSSDIWRQMRAVSNHTFGTTSARSMNSDSAWLDESPMSDPRGRGDVDLMESYIETPEPTQPIMGVEMELDVGPREVEGLDEVSSFDQPVDLPEAPRLLTEEEATTQASTIIDDTER